jgi:hypothetical protein
VSEQRPEGQTAGSVLPYRLGMPARNLPTPQDAATARRILLGGLAQGTEVAGLAGELAPLHPRDNTFPGRQNKKLQFAILAAAALSGGAEPDLLDEVAWWQTDDFWQYALYAAVAYIRAAAGRVGVPVRQVCQELAKREARGPNEP